MEKSPVETELPEPHGEIITFRDGRVVGMALSPTASAAKAAAGDA